MGKIKIFFASAIVLLATIGCREETTTVDWCILSHVEGLANVWKPDAKTIPKILSNAKSYLERVHGDSKTPDYQKHETEKILAQWDRSRCQVVGYEKDGEKIIRLNFFPKFNGSDDPFKQWRTEWVSVMDGGPSFWELSFDVTTGKFLDFGANGYARTEPYYFTFTRNSLAFVILPKSPS
jgi:hypothetical protein